MELADHHIKTRVNPATQLMESGEPASLKEDIEIEHVLDAFYVKMILWQLGIGKEAQVLGYACLKFVEMLQRKCLSKLMTNTFGNRVSHQGPKGEGVLFSLLKDLQNGYAVTALKLVSDILYDRWPLRALTIKRDKEEAVMITICNRVIANTPVDKESLNHACYTTPKTFGYVAQMMKIDQHEDRFQQMMAPFYEAPPKTQNRHPADVRDKNQGSPLEDDEPADLCVILVKRQQLDSTTKPDARPKNTTTAAPMSFSVRAEQVIEDQPIPRVLQFFYWWVSRTMTYVSEKTQVHAINLTKSTICDMLSEEMANTAVPQALKRGMHNLSWPLWHGDKRAETPM